MNTYMLRRGRPTLTGITEFERVVCRGVRQDAWFHEDRTPCPHPAVHVIDGVACCGKHRIQVERSKRSNRLGLPRWFVEAAVLSPQEAKLLLGKEPKVKRRWIRRKPKRVSLLVPASVTHAKGK